MEQMNISFPCILCSHNLLLNHCCWNKGITSDVFCKLTLEKKWNERGCCALSPITSIDIWLSPWPEAIMLTPTEFMYSNLKVNRPMDRKKSSHKMWHSPGHPSHTLLPMALLGDSVIALKNKKNWPYVVLHVHVFVSQQKLSYHYCKFAAIW